MSDPYYGYFYIFGERPILCLAVHNNLTETEVERSLLTSSLNQITLHCFSVSNYNMFNPVK